MEVCAAIICNENKDKVLIAQRPEGKSMAFHWEFPGGKVEPNESLKECLRRELKEELRIDATIHQEVFDIVEPKADQALHLHFFLCSIGDQIPVKAEHNDLKWVTRKELEEKSLPFCHGDRTMLEKVDFSILFPKDDFSR